MGNCTYCGAPAGFLRSAHKECRNTYESGKNQITSLIVSTATHGGEANILVDQLSQISASHFIDPTTLRSLLVKGWEQAVEHAFDDGILTEEEELNLMSLQENFSLSEHDLDTHGAYTQVVKGAVLRDVLEGKIPDRVPIPTHVPFNLQKTEKLIWVFQNVKYYEQKTRRQYVSGSRGVSIRIAKGVYYRVGAFKGNSVESTETIHVATGLLGVTNKHIYFSSGTKNFRIRHDKIVSFDPYSDGIGLQRDAATAKPQLFVTGDGWFTYNLLANVAQL